MDHGRAGAKQSDNTSKAANQDGVSEHSQTDIPQLPPI
jgi:hypothetical protein